MNVMFLKTMLQAKFGQHTSSCFPYLFVNLKNGVIISGIFHIENKAGRFSIDERLSGNAWYIQVSLLHIKYFDVYTSENFFRLCTTALSDSTDF